MRLNSKSALLSALFVTVLLGVTAVVTAILGRSLIYDSSLPNRSVNGTPALDLSHVPPEMQARDSEIRLDFRPFTDPMSTFVLRRGDGEARVVHYSNFKLTVAAVYQGNLPEMDVTRLLTKTRDPVFREALRRKNFGGTGLSRGDQFYLSLESSGNAAGECFGFVEDVPAVVRSLVKDLLALRKGLQEAILADAYVRSEPIAKERFEALRRNGRLRFTSVQEFSPDIQSILTSAISGPRDFFALSRTQYEQLLTLFSPSHEFLVIDNGSGHQLNLFKARDGTALPSKGDK